MTATIYIKSELRPKSLVRINAAYFCYTPRKAINRGRLVEIFVEALLQT